MIHLARDGAQLGQFSLEQVNAMVAAGQLRLTDLCWKEGLPNWAPLSTLEGLAATGGADRPPAAAAALPGSVYSPPTGVVSGSFHQPGQVPPGSIQALKETRPWVLFIAILGIIGTGLMLLAGLGMMLAGGTVAVSAGAPAGLSATMIAGMAVLYLVLAVIYIYPIMKLFKYSAAIKRLSYSGAAADLDEALRQQKSFWKFVGILAIILIVFYVILIVAIVFGGAGLAGMARPAPGPP